MRLVIKYMTVYASVYNNNNNVINNLHLIIRFNYQFQLYFTDGQITMMATEVSSRAACGRCLRMRLTCCTASKARCRTL